MRRDASERGRRRSQDGQSIIRTPRRKARLGLAVRLFHQDPTFRGFIEFVLIGAVVLAFLHPPTLPDLRALLGSAAHSIVSSVAEPPSLSELLEEARNQGPNAPSPRDIRIDPGLFAGSPHQAQRRLRQAVSAYEAGDPAKAIEILNDASLEDPNVLLVRGLAMLALPGFENLQAGIGFLDRAAEMGQRQAKVYRGLLFVTGPASVERDPERGLALMRQAADAGDAVASRLVGTSYHRGWGGIVDQGLSVSYMRKAVEGGDPEAHVALAYFTLNGLGVTRDEAEGTRLITKAAELGHAEGQAVLGSFYLMQFVGGWMPNPSEAVRWLGRAAEQGEVDAMMWLGRIYLELGKEPPWLDPPRGATIIERCAALWHAPCLFGLATVLDMGTGTARDPVRAHAYYSLALQLGMTKARERLAALTPGMSDAQRAQAHRLAETLAYRRLTGDPDAELPRGN